MFAFPVAVRTPRLQELGERMIQQAARVNAADPAAAFQSLWQLKCVGRSSASVPGSNTPGYAGSRRSRRRNCPLLPALHYERAGLVAVTHLLGVVAISIAQSSSCMCQACELEHTAIPSPHPACSGCSRCNTVVRESTPFGCTPRLGLHSAQQTLPLVPCGCCCKPRLVWCSPDPEHAHVSKL